MSNGQDPYLELIKAQEAYVIEPEYKTEDIYSPFYTPSKVSEITAYPFSLITEVYQAGKTYAGEAVEAVKNVVAYPYEKLTEILSKEKPTGILQSEFDLQSFISKMFKPPWIFLLLGIIGLWVYSVFKKG